MKIKPHYLSALGAISGMISPACSQSKQQEQHPNVIIVLADDQGYGDLACHGNPYLKTPNLDKIHNESIRLTDFHVAPMSSPTRGQLLTGVDCLRNGCMATCAGRNIVRDEFPMAGEFFASAGYATGLFGKWHVGYNWPHRPIDRGFQEAVYFDGFGLTGMGHHWNSDYYDPYYYHNEELKQAKGYCNDFWFSEAMKWMKASEKTGKPFFCYLPTNLAHFPEWIDSSWSLPYKGLKAANFYGMIANIDANMGKLDSFLKATKLFDNTILIYLTDNGTVHKEEYNAGMNGGKCARTDGGHRVPCFIRWPNGSILKSADIQTPAQVQDILPTLLDLCNIKSDARFDGISLASLLKGETAADRMFVVQYYQMNVVKNDAAVIWNQWRFLPMYGDQLYDIKTDPGQKTDISKDHPDIVAKMKAFYEQWWRGVEPRINDFVATHIGSEKQKEVKLCSSCWMNVRADGNASARQPKKEFADGGAWQLEVDQEGTYTIEVRRWPREADASLAAGVPAFIPRFGTPEEEGKALPIAKVHITIGTIDTCIAVTGSEKAVVCDLKLGNGKTVLRSWFSDAQDKAISGVFYAYIRKK